MNSCRGSGFRRLFPLLASLPAAAIVLPVVPPTAGAGEVILPSELEYLGAFRMPGDRSSSSEWPYGGGALTYYPYGDPNGPDDGFPGSLFARGKNNVISEVSIPVPKIVANEDGDALPQGTTLQDFADVTGGIRDQVGVDNVGGVAYLPAQAGQSSGHLYWTIYEYYNAAGVNYLSHGMSSLDLSNPQAKGAWRLGGTSDEFHSMKTADYIFDVPADWANANVGGKMLVSGRHRENGAFGGAQGPALYAFAPWQSSDLSNGAVLPAVCLLRYPTGGGYFPGYCSADYWTGGAWLTAGNRGAVIIVGSKGLGESYYGIGGPERCSSYKGFHCDPYEAEFLFYNPDDLAAVARGQRQPWQVLPFAIVNPTEMWPKCRVRPQSAAYDRWHNLFFVIQYNGAKVGSQSTSVPIVHVWRVSGEPVPPPDNGGDPPPDGGQNDGQGNQGQGGQAQVPGLDSEDVAVSPNPTAETTTISLVQGIAPATVHASIHDLSGRLVHDFGRLSSPDVEWNAADVVSGIYFLRLETPGGSVTKKISLVR